MKLNCSIILGAILGIAFVLTFFGTNIQSKSKPKIKINLGNIIVNSHIYFLNYHIHHWFVNSLIFIYVLNLKKSYSNLIFDTILSFNIILILHGLMYDDWWDFQKYE